MAFLSCDQVGQALILWASNASPTDRAALCNALGCSEGDLSQVLAAIGSSPAAVRNVLGLGTAALEDAGTPNGVAELDSSGHVPASQLPDLAITDVFVVNSQAAMLGLTAQTGDVAVRLDEGRTYMLSAPPASSLSNWVYLQAPTSGGAVTSVNGQTGIVVLTPADIGLGNVNNTSDMNKPVSVPQQIALNTKADKGRLAGLNTQTGASYTVMDADAGYDIQCINANPFTLNIDTQVNQPVRPNFWALVSQDGAGTVTITALPGVTLRAPNGATTTAQYDARGIERVSGDEWRVW